MQVFIKQMSKLHLDFIDTIIHRVRDIVFIHCAAFVPDSFYEILKVLHIVQIPMRR